MENKEFFDRSSNSKHTDNKSEELFNKVKKDLFNKIYDILDADCDDEISIVTAKKSLLPSEVNKMLDPVYLKLKLDNCKLNKNEFSEYCQALFEVNLV